MIRYFFLVLVFISTTSLANTEINVTGTEAITSKLLKHFATSYIEHELKLKYQRKHTADDHKRIIVGKQGKKTVIEIHLHDSSSQRAYKKFKEGNVHLGLSSRSIKNFERIYSNQNNLLENLIPIENVLAIDGIAIIVHPQNPISAITTDKLAQIFSGEITDWDELGLPSTLGKIEIYAGHGNKDIYKKFKSLLTHYTEGLQVDVEVTPLTSHEEIAKKVSYDKNSLGITSFAYIEDSKPLDLIRKCGIRSKPNEFSLKTGAYPLANTLNLYIAKRDLSGRGTKNTLSEAAKFRHYILHDPKAQELIAKKGFFNRNIISMSIEKQEHRHLITTEPENSLQYTELQALKKLLQELEQLSISFHFDKKESNVQHTTSPQSHMAPNEDVNTYQNTANIQSLVNFLNTPKNQENITRIVLIGFADSRGSYYENATVSLNRAESVKEQLIKMGGYRFNQLVETRGFSELSPVTCNDKQGYQTNRRVEVWVQYK